MKYSNLIHQKQHALSIKEARHHLLIFPFKTTQLPYRNFLDLSEHLFVLHLPVDLCWPHLGI